MNTHFPRASAAPFVSTRTALSRRKFLRNAGILLSLPMLDAMTPAFAAAAKRIAAGTTPGGKPRRMFGICNNLGLLPEHFFPKESGRDYALSPYLELLKEYRDGQTRELLGDRGHIKTCLRRDGNVVLEVRVTITVLVNDRAVFHDHDGRAR